MRICACLYPINKRVMGRRYPMPKVGEVYFLHRKPRNGSFCIGLFPAFSGLFEDSGCAISPVDLDELIDRRDEKETTPAQMEPQEDAHDDGPQHADHHIFHRIRDPVIPGVGSDGVLGIIPKKQIYDIFHDLPQTRGGHGEQE